MSMNDIIVRKSKWNMWLICPRFYEQRWLLNLPRKNGVEAQYGRDFHKRAKEFFDEVDIKILPYCATAQKAFLGPFTNFQPSRGVIAEWMKNFLWWEANEWVRLFNQMDAETALFYWQPLATEWHYESNGEEYHVDRIDRLPFKQQLINIEYKTSKWMMKSKLRLELTWYNMGVDYSKKFDLPCTYIGYFNPQLDVAWSEPVKRYMIERVDKLVKDFRLAHKHNQFPCDKSNFCRYCDYFESCPCWQNELEVKSHV